MLIAMNNVLFTLYEFHKIMGPMILQYTWLYIETIEANNLGGQRL